MSNKFCPVCGSNESRKERVVNRVDLLKCRQCGFVFANIKDEIIVETNSRRSDRTAAIYEKIQSFLDTIWFQRIARRMTAKLGSGKILDVGCGNGRLLKSFIELGWEAYGVDLSPWSKKYADTYGFTLFYNSIEEASLPKEYFELVLSTSVMEHVARPYEHVVAMLEVLKPGGILYFAGIPNYGKITKGLKIAYIKYNPPSTVNFFTAKSMKTLFTQPKIKGEFSFINVATYGIPHIHLLYRFLRRLVKGPEDKMDGKPSTNSPVKSANAGSTLKALLGRLVVEIFYYLGKPFHLGDKLEVTAIKRSN
jgi:SAM-dependent methyltransferase